MSTLLTTPLQNAAMPRVNLLPPHIAEAAKLRKVQALLGLGVGLTVVGVVGLYVSASGAAGRHIAEHIVLSAGRLKPELRGENLRCLLGTFFPQRHRVEPAHGVFLD